MQMIKPITVDNTALEASNVTEDDYAEWDASTTYAVDDFVIVTGTTHKVYQSVQGGNLDNDPTTDDGAWWTEISATNRWKAFDSKLSDQVENADLITYNIRVPAGALVSGIAAFNVEADTVQVEIFSDIIVNGTFDTDTSGWTAYSGATLTQDAGELVVTGTNSAYSSAVQVVTVVPGRTYRLRVECTSADYGYQVGVGNGAWNDDTYFNSGIVYSTSGGSEDVTFTAIGTEVSIALAMRGLGTVGDEEARFDNVIFEETVYDETNSAVASTQVDDWYTYFYGDFDQASETLFLDQPSFQELPGYGGHRIAITITRTGGTAKVGQIVLGRLLSIGRTVKPGTSVTAQDFSVKGTDDFGNAILTQRGFSKEVDFSFVFPTGGAQRIDKIITDVRATPVVWLAGPGTSQYATTVYGWWEDYDLALEGNNSPARLRIKGLV